MSIFETSIRVADLYVKTHTQGLMNIKQEFSLLEFDV
jgi:hypothetical protein